jgi:lipopolysaccharide biosynthesis glycosyltransferase
MSAQPIIVVTSADDGYAMPLAAMVRSLLANLAGAESLRLFVLDGGIGTRNRQRLLASWPGERLTVEWLRPDVSRLRDVKVSGHIGLPTYFRILLGSAVPPTIERAIYLDADVVVEADLGALWAIDLDGHPLAAARDWIVLTVSAPNGLANWRELGLEASQPYFNAGVLLLDLTRWRRDGTEEKILDHLVRHRSRIRWWDQDGLNAVLGRDCLELDPRWNLNIRNRSFPAVESLPFDRAEYESVIAGARICHFATHIKPWHTDCEHPLRARFFHYLDQTSWAGWRPTQRAPEPRLGVRQRLAALLRATLPARW